MQPEAKLITVPNSIALNLKYLSSAALQLCTQHFLTAAMPSRPGLNESLLICAFHLQLHLYNSNTTLLRPFTSKTNDFTILFAVSILDNCTNHLYLSFYHNFSLIIPHAFFPMIDMKVLYCPFRANKIIVHSIFVSNLNFIN